MIMENTKEISRLCDFGDCTNEAVSTGRVFAIVFETATAEAFQVHVCEEHRNADGFVEDER